MNMSWKNCIASGVLAGVIWGWVSMAFNAISGAFAFEGSFAHNLATFSFAGAVFGAVVAAFLGLAGERLPFKRPLPKAVLASASLWLLLWVGGTTLSSMEPARYHLVTPQTVQGFTLAVVLGGILGVLWRERAVRG